MWWRVMRALGVAFLVACGGGAASTPPPSSHPEPQPTLGAVDQLPCPEMNVDCGMRVLAHFETHMCACKDKACTDHVDDAMLKWATASKAAPQEKPDPAVEQRASDIRTHYIACLSKYAPGPKVERLGSIDDLPCNDRKVGCALDTLAHYEKHMCGCKDKACGDMVNDKMTKWGTEMAKTASQDEKDQKPDPDQAKRAYEIMNHYTECFTKLMAESAPATSP